jgi:virginiamycin A acetyltransferase
MSGVKIGNGAVIGAKAVVAKDIPDYAIAIGNPAKVIRYRFKPETIVRLLALRWWDWDIQKITANMDLLYTNPDNWPQDLHFL